LAVTDDTPEKGSTSAGRRVWPGEAPAVYGDLVGDGKNRPPNRYGIPAFYALHVWAWQGNPDGVFADCNRKVSCAAFHGTSESNRSWGEPSAP
jgi:hypothetical protein